ncbi:MAG: BamA/TamA family outer membrane protein [Desulfamplus sp.]|nr:BamA/TamA family outer membrane protein [Desulfamplus sp.]
MVKSISISLYSIIHIFTVYLIFNTILILLITNCFIPQSYAQDQTTQIYGQQQTTQSYDQQQTTQIYGQENTIQSYAQKKVKQIQELTQVKPIEVKCINIKALKFNGNYNFSDIRLKMRMKSWHSSLLPGNFNCYNEDWLKKDIITLVDFYRKKGFPDVDIGYLFKQTQQQDEGLVKKQDDGVVEKQEEGVVEINIAEGLEYEILFKGNNFFSQKELRKKIDLVKKGNANDTALSRAKVDIKNSYLDAGFEDVTVNFSKKRKSFSNKPYKQNSYKPRSDEPKKDEIWIVEFLINEGTRKVVNQLKIEGNKLVSKDEILDSMLTREKEKEKNLIREEIGGYNSNVLDKDINAIELLYLSKGFLNAKISKKINKLETTITSLNNITSSLTTPQATHQVTHQDVQLIDIMINIEEGTQTIVDNVNIIGFDSKYLTKLSLKHGEPFREYMVKSDENSLSMIVSELGYPHVKVISDIKLNSNATKADITWQVEKGKFTRFGKINYSGNKRLKDDVIARRLDIASGEPFSLKKVFATEKKIRESSAVKSVEIKSPELTLMKEEPDIEIAIEESNPYFVEAAIGYDTEQNLYLDTKIGDNNFSGREIDAWLEASVSGIGYRAESGLKKPFFLGTKIEATGNIYIEDEEELNKTFGVKAWGYETGFSRELFIKNLIAGLNLNYENRTVYGELQHVDIDELESRNILVTSFSLGYDSRDSSIRPTKGFLSTSSVEVYNGFDNDLDRFFKYQIDLRTYFSPFRTLSSFNSSYFNRVTFALRGRMGYIQPFGAEDSVAQDQLFFLGGTSNVRGFKENMLEYDSSGNPLGGCRAINSTLEARVDLPADFEFSLFLDTGKVDNLTNKIDLTNSLESNGFRSSVGVGLRYITPIGPVGLLYGHKLDTEDGESPGRIHFSVGYTF